MKELFFTGFPGFIAERLVERILEHEPDARFHFLVHPSMAAKAGKVTALFEQKHPETKVGLYQGDITRPHLGMAEAEYKTLTQSVTDVFHLAAVYDLATPHEIAHQVNVTGTQMVLDFARDCKSLAKVVYFSTCYVAGKRTGRVFETELEKGQEFKNHYESTKHLAEIDVRAAMAGLPIITIRPAIVVGDSKTGETAKFDGLYFILRFFYIFDFLVEYVGVPFLGDMPAYFNIVPVDYVVDGTVALWEKEGNEGTTYALADPNPMKAAELYTVMAQNHVNKTPSWTLPHGLLEFALGIGFLRQTLGIPPEALTYLKHKVEYDTTNAVRDLKGSGVECPRFADYAPVLMEYYFRLADNEEKKVVIK